MLSIEAMNGPDAPAPKNLPPPPSAVELKRRLRIRRWQPEVVMRESILLKNLRDLLRKP